MKKLFITLVCFSAVTVSAIAQEQKKEAGTLTVNSKAGEFKFSEETHDFGEVPEGPAAEYDFVFTNAGKEPIIISNAKGSCGCTVPQWPKEPVMPGKKASIRVTYSTAGRPGPIAKDVFITSNAKQSPMVLHIKGSVKAKAVETAGTH